jgi:hypothetical protein
MFRLFRPASSASILSGISSDIFGRSDKGKTIKTMTDDDPL